MFAKRNSLTLAAIWLILLCIGIFWYVRDTQNLVGLMKEQVVLSGKLKDSQKEIKRLVQVETAHTELKNNWLNSDKKIISADEPAFSLSYINWIMEKNGLPIDFDFNLNATSKEKNHTKFVYSVHGEARYSDILKLIWHLTYEPILYQINSVTLRRTVEDQDFLQFNIKLQGFSVESDLQLEEYSELRPTEQQLISGYQNIFNPLVRPKPKPVVRKKIEARKLPSKQPGEVDVQRATLKAITNNSIFINDGSSGLKQLKVGDKVYLGKLVSINQSTNSATFIITKFGRSQTITLSLDLRK